MWGDRYPQVKGMGGGPAWNPESGRLLERSRCMCVCFLGGAICVMSRDVLWTTRGRGRRRMERRAREEGEESHPALRGVVRLSVWPPDLGEA